MEETVRARGHENVTARHASTFEVTTEDYLTPAGDCILGIEANNAPADFETGFVHACQDQTASITATVAAASRETVITGRGHPDLSFTSSRSLVGRTSGYVDDRTVMVAADKAASDIDPGIVEALAGGAELTLTLRVL